MKADEARLHLEAARNFADIAEVKAEGREENLSRAIDGYKKALIELERKCGPELWDQVKQKAFSIDIERMYKNGKHK